MGQRPVNGIICSSMQTLPGFGRLRQPCLTLSRSGLTFQRMSFFFVFSITSGSLTIFSKFLNLKNLFLGIFWLIIGTLVLLAQNILILGKPRQAMRSLHAKEDPHFFSSGVKRDAPYLYLFQICECCQIFKDMYCEKN